MDKSQVDVLVFEALQANAGADFVRQLVEAFAIEAPDLIAQMRSAISAGNQTGLETLAHSLKSNAVAFGATRLAQMAAGLEWTGLPAGASAVDDLADEAAAALAQLRRLAQT